MKSSGKIGIGYTVLVNSYALMTTSERKVDQREWPLTDEGERRAIEAAKEEATRCHVHYAGELK